ncbi:BTAD domain-containing putative transcriptional regulator [Nonomuraea sp. NEAU-A123]|uniref:AfsR/SARP family transcriptional regulator n=1 Tax=Nonomuraea sp. NEAU-A123 TaxID=2839649 RepID=UPI001BE41E84|nr:BTAD domain-containing putative transcriptional regulator [Nonomuraea sp. NEAU-A123]MBT2225208.1 tetratricopeptide repeat protein [Nonomuraea sp. NEAU-A123]
MLFTVLGPVSLTVADQTYVLRRAQARGLLGFLLLHANRVVSAESLIEAMWGGAEPSTARSQIQAGISAIRKQLRDHGAEDILSSEPAGYRLRLQDDQLDRTVFEQRRLRARQMIDNRKPADAAAALRSALDMWRGPTLGGASGAYVEGSRARLLDQFLTASEELVELELELGRHNEVIAEFMPSLDEHPSREPLRGQLMLGLYRAGRQVDALELYRFYRTDLAEQHGLDPNPALSSLQQAILVNDPALDKARTLTGESSAHAANGMRTWTAVAQLPPSPPDFIGRTAELKRLDDLLPTAITLIAGPAGVGKTALAVHWARLIADRFPDGQIYANLRGYDPGLPASPLEVLAYVLRVLGVEPEQIPADERLAESMYRTLLSNKRVLVLLDNARSAEQVRPLLLGGSNCLVVVTSRDRLSGLVARDGARRLTLDVLDPSEAHELLIRLLGEDLTRAEEGAIAALAATCGYLPLAVRIAAAQLLDNPYSDITEYTAELRRGSRMARLRIDGDEQTAVRVAFDQSYATLTSDAQKVFRRMGLIPGVDFTAFLAAAIADLSPGEAERLLERLARAHLVEMAAPGRYAFHDLLRDYAQAQTIEQESESDVKGATKRLFDYYVENSNAAARILYPSLLRLPASASPGKIEFGDATGALAWLDAERPNLVAVVLEAADIPDETAWQLTDAMRGYFQLRGDVVDWVTSTRAALDAARSLGDLRAQAACHLSLGMAQFFMSRYSESIEYNTQAATLSKAADWPSGQAVALGNLSMAYVSCGELLKASNSYQQALVVNRDINWRAGQANNLGNLGLLYIHMGDLRLAFDCACQTVELYRASGDQRYQAMVFGNLAEICLLQGRLSDALDHLTKALGICQGIDGLEAESILMQSVLARVHLDAGRYDQALRTARSATELASHIGDQAGKWLASEAAALNALAKVEVRLGHLREAVAHSTGSLQLARQKDNPYEQIEALIELAVAYMELGRHDEAHGHLYEALSIARSRYRLLEGVALTTMAEIRFRTGQTADAIVAAQEALMIHHETGYRLGQARTLIILSRLVDRKSARPLLHQALDISAEIGAPEEEQVLSLLSEEEE